MHGIKRTYLFFSTKIQITSCLSRHNTQNKCDTSVWHDLKFILNTNIHSMAEHKFSFSILCVNAAKFISHQCQMVFFLSFFFLQSSNILIQIKQSGYRNGYYQMVSCCQEHGNSVSITLKMQTDTKKIFWCD